MNDRSVSGTTSKRRPGPGKRPPDWVNPKKGKPNGKARPIEERYWPKVSKGDGCWIWTGATRQGYGCIWAGEEKRVVDAHRLALIFAGVELPEGMLVDHLCMEKLCVNPAHLRVVTPKVSATENCASPIAKNAAKTHCTACSKPLAGENLALYTRPGPRKNRHGNVKASPLPQRVCLTCHPTYWKWAVVPRSKPARAPKASK